MERQQKRKIYTFIALENNNGHTKKTIHSKDYRYRNNFAEYMYTRAKDLRVAFCNFQLWSIGREKIKFLKLSQMNGFDK